MYRDGAGLERTRERQPRICRWPRGVEQHCPDSVLQFLRMALHHGAAALFWTGWGGRARPCSAGCWTGLVRDRLVERGAEPFVSLVFFVWETLAYMLFGMAALKTGLLTGQWPPERYRKIALVGLAVTIPAYVVLAWTLLNDGFSVPMVLAIGMLGLLHLQIFGMTSNQGARGPPPNLNCGLSFGRTTIGKRWCNVLA